jgi:hypothetical protein
MRITIVQRAICIVFYMVLRGLLIFLPSRDLSASPETIRASQRWAEKEAQTLVSKIRKEHPGIFLTKERIPALKTQAPTTKGHIFKLLEERMKGPQAALFYVLGEAKTSHFFLRLREICGAPIRVVWRYYEICRA